MAGLEPAGSAPQREVVTALTSLLKTIRRAKTYPMEIAPGLTAAHRTLLADLAHMQGDQGCRLADLACGTRLDPSTVSREIASLVKLGLVERRPDAQDGRATRLISTPAGHEAVERYRERIAAVLDRSLDGWTEQQLQTFAELLQRFVSGLDDALSLEVSA